MALLEANRHQEDDVVENHSVRRSQETASAVLGALLVFAGLLYLVIRYFPGNIAGTAWPIFVILPGMVLLFFALAAQSASGLAVPGVIVIVVGLILAIQNTFGIWATWSYAWTLVAPGALGLGLCVKGVIDGDARLVHQGGWLAASGLGLFAVFALFFEGALSISGFDLGAAGNLVVPILLIAIGLALLVRTLIRPSNPPGQALP